MFMSLNLALYSVFKNMLMMQSQLYNYLLSEIMMNLLHDHVLTQDNLDCKVNNESSQQRLLQKSILNDYLRRFSAAFNKAGGYRRCYKVTVINFIICAV